MARQDWTPLGLVGAGAVSVQFGAALATELFGRVGPVGTVTVRLVIAAVILVATARPGWLGLPTRSPSSSNRTDPPSRVDLAVATGFGLVLAGMNLSFYEAISRIPLGAAVTVEFSGPLAVALVGSRRWPDALWGAMAGTGVALLASDTGHGLDPAGVALAAIAGAFWIGYILLNKQTGQRFDTSTGLTTAMVAGALAVLPAGVVAEGGHLFSMQVLVLGTVVALLSSVIPYSFELLVLRRVTPRAFGVMLSLDPAMAALAGFVVLAQRPGARELTAMVLVVAANLGNSLVGRPAPAITV